MTDRVLIPDSVAPADQTVQRTLVADNQSTPSPLIQMAGKAASWFSHLGQPEWAKKLVETMTNDPSLKDVSGYDPMAAMGGGLINNTSIAPKTDVSKMSPAVDAATSPMSYVGEGVGLLGKIPAVASRVAKTSDALGNTSAKVSSTLNQLPIEALQKVSTKEGAQAVIDAGKNQTQIAGNVVSAANDVSKYAGKGSDIEAKVRFPEGGAASVDIRPILKAFDDAKTTPNDLGGNTVLSNKVNAALDAEKRSVAGGTMGNKSGSVGPVTDVNGVTNYTLPATQVRETIKTPIGKGINWTDAEQAEVKSRMKGVYSVIKDQLKNSVEKTQGPEVADQYEKDLSDWSQKINDFGELNSKLGKNPSTRLDKALAMVRNANESDKPGLTDLLQRIEAHTGTPLTEDVKNAQIANMFTKFGKGHEPLDPSQIGKPALLTKGKLVPAVPSSPLLGVLGIKAAKALPSLSGKATKLSPALSGAGSLGRNQ